MHHEARMTVIMCIYFIAFTLLFMIKVNNLGGEKMQDDEQFTIRDKRRFKEGGDESGVQKEQETQQAGPAELAEAGTEEQPNTIPAEINFAAFIFSLGRSAFIHLGEEPDPVSGVKKVSLQLAKETIDIISMLEEKTKGNLAQEEGQLIKNLLYALRMRYIELASKKG